MTLQWPWGIPVHRCWALALALSALGGGVQAEIQNSGGVKWVNLKGDGGPPPA
jgi:hypothetical protein